MMPKEELLQYIHKTADMGVSGLEDVLPKTEDQELFSTLEKQKTQYEKSPSGGPAAAGAAGRKR